MSAGRARGKAQLRNCDHALENARETVAHLGRGRADGDRARDIGRAVDVLAAGIDEEKLARAQLAVGCLGHTVVHDRAIRPRAGDRVEADLLQGLCFRALGFERAHGCDLIDAAVGRFAIEPCEETRDSNAVAFVRDTRAADFSLVLARLGKNARIGGVADVAARAAKALPDPHVGGRHVEADALLLGS